MSAYKPAEHEGATSVAPLLEFFELVHIGDTIQSMVQVFFDKEIVRRPLSAALRYSDHSSTQNSVAPKQAPHIDKTDFLNAVVREKKRFENTLDDCVASGLNAGTQVLMNQVRSCSVWECWWDATESVVLCRSITPSKR